MRAVSITLVEREAASVRRHNGLLTATNPAEDLREVASQRRHETAEPLRYRITRHSGRISGRALALKYRSSSRSRASLFSSIFCRDHCEARWILL